MGNGRQFVKMSKTQIKFTDMGQNSMRAVWYILNLAGAPISAAHTGQFRPHIWILSLKKWGGSEGKSILVQEKTGDSSIL